MGIVPMGLFMMGISSMGTFPKGIITMKHHSDEALL